MNERPGAPVRTWSLLLAAMGTVLAGAVSPVVLGGVGRTVAMTAFAPVCHQLPGRSLHVNGVQLAVCDRCLGIYLGLFVGVATIWGVRRLWRRARAYDRVVLLGSLVPMGIDWVGPVLGLWPNVPVSRFGTGLLFGVVAASFVAHRIVPSFGRR